MRGDAIEDAVRAALGDLQQTALIKNGVVGYALVWQTERSPDEIVKRIVAALADVGLLVEPGGETRVEWVYRHGGWTGLDEVTARRLAEEGYEVERCRETIHVSRWELWQPTDIKEPATEPALCAYTDHDLLTNRRLRCDKPIHRDGLHRMVVADDTKEPSP